jgi:hypothetical protein
MSVSLSSKLPSGDGNGLEAIVYDLNDAKKIHVCICLVSGKKGTTDFESGETVTTARLRRIEVILDPDDLKLAENLMRRALDRRTGRESLPYDLEEEIRGAFPVDVEDLPSEDQDQ